MNTAKKSLTDLMKASKKGPGSRGGKIIGKTKSGKAIYAPHSGLAKKQKAASTATAAHGMFHNDAFPAIRASNVAHDKHFKDTSEGFTIQDHKDAKDALSSSKWEHATDQDHQHAFNAISNRHSDAAGKMKDEVNELHYKLASARGDKMLHQNLHAKTGKKHPGHDDAHQKVKDVQAEIDKRQGSVKKSTLTDLMKAGKGVGSRGGVVAYHTKSDKNKNDTAELIGHHSVAKKSLEGLKENNMSQFDDLFKSELAHDEQALTNCVHCEEPLTKSDLVKGSGTNFVGSDNNQPHSGSGASNSATPARTGGGAKETDNIAPLLKGQEHGIGEEFLLTKSEIEMLGGNITHLDGDGDTEVVITKGDLDSLSNNAEPYARMKKAAKGYDKNMKKMTMPEYADTEKGKEKAMSSQGVAKGAQDGPGGLGGMAHGPGGAPLIIWETGTDEQVAKAIAEGALGAAGEESIRTEGTGRG